MMERSQKTYRWHFRQIGDDVLTHTLYNPCANSAKGPDDLIQDVCVPSDIRKKYSIAIVSVAPLPVSPSSDPQKCALFCNVEIMKIYKKELQKNITVRKREENDDGSF